jgi:thiamine pyrophosphate-dependent acetolactate synthase large subunit-like protein
MRQLVHQYLTGAVSRRGFLAALGKLGFTAVAANSLVEAAETGSLPEQAAAPQSGARNFSGSGGDLMTEQVKAAGTRFIFTNPGSYEVGFFDALVDRPELILIEGLHEGLVVSMADGYSRVSGKPGFVNVHAVAGTAQMAGQLYNAHRDGIPLIVTAGMADITTFSDDIALGPVAGFHQTDINRQFTKLSWDTREATSIPLHVRRAFKTATSAPGGPVYLCLGSNALEQQRVTAEIWPADTFMIPVRPRPATDQVESLARMLIEAERPVIIPGDEVWKSGAQPELLELCELLGIAAAEGWDAFQNFPSTHPLFTGEYVGSSEPYPRGSADLVLQVGARDWGLSMPWPRMAPGGRFAAIGIEPAMLGRTQPLNLAIVADVKATLRELIAAVQSIATADRIKKQRDTRYEWIVQYSRAMKAARAEAARKNFGQTPIHPDQLGVELDQTLDPHAIIVSENFTGPTELFKLGHRADEKMWVSATGTSLGWGIGAAIGAKLAAPDRQVVCSIGDGAVMYSASGFWTMKRYEIPLLTIVWNNKNYQTVRSNFALYNGRMKDTGRYPGMYIGDPDIDFVKLAESQGVRGERVIAPAGLKAALTRGIQATKEGNPYVVEVVIARVGVGAESTWYQKFSAKTSAGL